MFFSTISTVYLLDILDFDACNMIHPEDIFVGETEMFICRLILLFSRVKSRLNDFIE